MSEPPRMALVAQPTGVPGLDEVLGGGLPEYSFNLIMGGPGSGKTTLAHQIMFANATTDRPGIYFTVLGEPALKMLRYQQQMAFFDPGKVGSAIYFINLIEEVLEGDLNRVLQRIVHEVETISPSFVMVDSFRTVLRGVAGAMAGELELQAFVQHLAVRLTSWQATTFLIGEYTEPETENNPVFTVADGILWLSQHLERNTVIRKLQVMKMRGQAMIAGRHTFQITNHGVEVFPRLSWSMAEARRVRPGRRVSMGESNLDSLLGGGPMAGDTILVAGPSGSGKTMLALQFVTEGVRRGEAALIAVFAEHPIEYIERARMLGLDLDAAVRNGLLEVLFLRPLDLSVDEMLRHVEQAASRLGAKRVVIDSLSGLELALAASFREDFREALYRLAGLLTGSGITVLMTVELTESFTEISFSPHEVAFLADVVILQRYAEIRGRLQKVLVVVKVRSGDHSKEWHAYDVTRDGIVIGPALAGHSGIITGVPTPSAGDGRPTHPGLAMRESLVLEALREVQEAPVEALAHRTGLRRTPLVRALTRLVTLDYASRASVAGQTVYRARAGA